MPWQWEICLLIIIGIMMTLLVFVILSWTFLIHVSGFNMTQRMEKDEILVGMCMKYHLNNTICDKLYGGIPENSKGNINNNYSVTNNSVGYNISGY